MEGCIAVLRYASASFAGRKLEFGKQDGSIF